MAKYWFQVNYVGPGVAGLMKEGASKRGEAARHVIESAGGTLECLYYAFGDVDAVGICDMPTVASAVSVSLIINASGAVTVKLTPLISAEDMDAAGKMGPSYRPPGQ